MHSCLYEGTIRHRRFIPRTNQFRYRVFFTFLDLDELSQVFDLHPLWSEEKLNIATYRRRDHFGDPDLSLDQSVRDLVENRLGVRPEGPIRLLTHLRYYGHCFNPASFYYCYNAESDRVDTVVVEIHNTPWGQRHCYVLGAEQNEHPTRYWRRHRFGKVFHVSPFIDMDIQYDWRFREPGEKINVHMIDFKGKDKLFDASLALKRTELSRSSMSRVLYRYPLLTGKVVFLIYWQALRLVLKKVPFYPHPEKTEPNAKGDRND